ncbi:hypothetical protein QTO34_018138 [Cnephaeus nilssonii]|uniref:Cytoplasmic 60S subunit biogenesis factor ZNF622 n=1 Tax=Cnephaeus nilssonii TaxID=3371016 RepID=A0AA40LNJ4_CNENI|nr:hypothetical protein QTO34_018138 [Eptesicus nilssonii]
MTQTLSSRCQWRRELSVLLAQSATPATLSPAPCASCWPNRGRSGVMKSMKGFYFAKLYYEAKEYDLAKKYISTYINVQERDPKAHRFLGLLYEVEENIDKAVECYKRSVELNPTQKDLVLKIAELLCKNDVTDGRAKYWVERAAKLFPGSPAIYKLKSGSPKEQEAMPPSHHCCCHCRQRKPQLAQEQLLDCEGEDGWNKLFDLIQSELYARPDDVYVNIRLVELYRSNKRLKDAAAHCHEAERNVALRSSLEWNLCVVQTLKEYLESLQSLDSDKSNWQATNEDLLLAYANLMLLTLSTRDIQESRDLLESFDGALQSVKSCVGGNDELSAIFLEIKGHFYMHAGSLLLKMGQHSDVQWRALSELAALCYLIAFQVPRPKIKLIKGEGGQNLLETMAFDRLSQSGHMLLNLSRDKQDFLKEVVESFANKSGQSALYDALFSGQSPKDSSFLGSDDIGNIDVQAPETDDLARYDVGAIRAHNGSLQHLTWLGLQWNLLPTPPAIRKWLKQLFHHLPQETSRLETNAPESICILDLEVFLLGVIYNSDLQLKEKCSSHYNFYQPLCLPFPVCKQLCTERQKSWWDAVCNLIHRKAIPGTSAKLRLLVQRDINTLRGQERHGLQPALLIHWANYLQKTGSDLNSFYDQREYIGRSVHYWKKVLPLLKMIKKRISIPEPTDPLFKHFHSADIQASEIGEYEEEAHITFAILDAVNGNIEDAMTAFESIKNVVSYWNLALIFHRKAEDIENDAHSPEEQEECKNYLRKTRDYLIKILDDSDSNLSVLKKTDWQRYNLKRKVADMALVTAEGFQERVRVQRAVAEQESKGTATSCTICCNKFGCLNAYENHLKSWQHVELERKTMNRRGEMMKEKNLEKGLGVDSVDRDDMNAAIQQVINVEPPPKRAPPAPRKESGGPGAVAEGGRAADDRDPDEKPPRLQWFEWQAKKLAKQPGEEEKEEGDLDGDNWEDTDSDEEMECDDAESMGELEEHDAEEEEAGGGAPLGAISIKDSLFCSHHSSSHRKNVAHMTKIHSFFLPDIEYLLDLKGLIQSLGEKVGVGKICLWCNEKGKSFYSMEAVQAHMNDKSHCKLFTLPVPLESVKDMLNSVMQQLDEYSEGGPLYKNGSLRNTDSEMKYSTPSPTKYSLSPSKSYKYSPKAPPQWAEDQNSLLKMICQQVEAIKKEMQELKLNSSNLGSPHRWPTECYGPDSVPDGYQGSQTFQGAPLTVATTGTSVYYSQSPAYNSQYLLRPAANVTPTKGPVYGMNRLPPQQHIYAYSQQMHTPPVQSTSACMFSQEMYGPPLRFESPATGILSPRGDDYFNYNIQQTSTNPPLPEPGYFTKPPVAAHASRSAESKVIEFGKTNFVQPMPGEGIRPSLTAPTHTTQPPPFKFNSNFKSNDGDFTFSSPQVVTQPPSMAYNNSESLLGLLTSEKPLQGDGYSGAKAGQTIGSRNTFNFGSKNVPGISFTENIGPNQKNSVFCRSDDMFTFHGPGKSVFGTPAPEVANKNHEADGGSAHGDDDDDGPHFEPVVPLPDKIEVKTGEEDEEEFFCNRAKLFRFDAESKEWKERGIGNVKILRHKTSGKIRLLMRREQVLKICANHYISPDMKLTPNAGSDRSFVWHALDYADEFPKPEQLAIRFKTPEEAALFKCQFEEAQNILKASGAKATTTNKAMRIIKEPASHGNKDICKSDARNMNFEFQVAKKEGSWWHCNSCSLKNAATAKKCVSCQNLNPSNKELLGPPLVETIPTLKISPENTPDRFALMIPKNEGHWDCSICLVRNEPTVSRCIACQNTKSANKSGSLFVQQPSFKFGQGDLPKSVNNDFRSVFSVKEGQWDCSVCLVQNEGSSSRCIACDNSRKQNLPTVSAPAACKFGASEIYKTPKSGFEDMFTKKDGQWDCSVCLVRNEANAAKCAACHNPGKPSPSSSAVPVPASFKFSTSETSKATKSGFEGVFTKKEGQWDCSVCFVRNEASTTKCIACQNPSTQNQPTPTVSAPASSETSKATKSGFEGMFTKKEGQWDCSVCFVRNEASTTKCVACQNPSTQNQPTPTVSAPASSETSKATKSGFEGMFTKKEGQWDCSVCFVRNESSSLKCVACDASKPTHKPIPEAPSAFTLGSKAKLNDSSGNQMGTGFKSNFSEKAFKFGITEQGFKFGHVDQENTPSFTFQSSNKDTNSTIEGFNFSIPVLADGFKFGIQELGNQEKNSEKPLEKDNDFQAQGVSSQKNDTGVIFGQTGSTFTFADLAKSTSGEGFQFGKKDPNFKGFSGAGEKLFSLQSGKKADKADNSTDLERDDDAYKTEDSDDIHFEPVVQMPEKVELVTGEEDEKVLYSQRVKLFRFDAEISQWKERGLGNLKILKNEVNGKLRMLMRREQVLKVCANHWITTTMNLKPLSGSDRAWMWLASDFSDGDAKLEQLAAKFKTPELAEEFKQKFEECQRLLLDIPLQTPHKLVDTGRAAKLIQRAEEMKSGLKDFKTFLTNDQTKVTEEESKNSDAGAASVSDITTQPNPENTGSTLEWSNYDLREDALDDSVSTSSVHASPLASSPVRKNLFRFGESTTGFNFSFKSALSPSKSPAMLNQSGTTVGNDEESDVTQEEERDGQYFEPVVPLPDLVEVSSGEENEQVVFSHRAKLYRYDKDVGQWKERGIGDIKILQNYDNKQVRIVMRRDQVLKLCANHRITPDMTLQNMKGTERVWVWTACDFADGERKVEHLAVRFKLQDVADSFKKIFDEAKIAQEKGSLITPHVSFSTTPRESPCGRIAVAVLEETTKERTDLLQGDDVADATSEVGDVSSTSETATKAVVSPPKFVFGSESVKSIFGSEKSKPFTFGNSSATGSLFGFSFNAPLKNSETSSGVQSGSERQVEPNNCEASKNSDIKQSPDGKVQNLFAAFPKEEFSTNYTFKTPEKAKEKIKPEDPPSDEDVLIVYELTPSPEHKALASKLKLPPTFFCYKNRPDYVSEEEEDDEDFETAVKKLNGKLYLDDSEKYKPLEKSLTENEKECIIVWEKKPTVEEKAKADTLKLPPTFFCGVSSDTDEDNGNGEDFQSELQKVQEAQKSHNEEITTSTVDSVCTGGTKVTVPFLCKSEEPDFITKSICSSSIFSGTVDKPVDLSTRKESDEDSTSQVESKTISFGFGSNTGLSFADLASSNSGDFAFGSKGKIRQSDFNDQVTEFKHN